MDRQVLIKEAMYRAFIDEIEKISGSLSEEDLEKLAGIFSRAGGFLQKKVNPAAQNLYQRAQVGAGNLMTSHKGHLLGEAAQEGLHHGGMWYGIDPSHALTGGAEGVAAALAPAAAGAAVKAVRKAAPVVREQTGKAVGFLRRKGREFGAATQEAFRPYIHTGPPMAPV